MLEGGEVGFGGGFARRGVERWRFKFRYGKRKRMGETRSAVENCSLFGGQATTPLFHSPDGVTTTNAHESFWHLESSQPILDKIHMNKLIRYSVTVNISRFHELFISAKLRVRFPVSE